MITLGLYLVAMVLTALSRDLMRFMFFRFLTGAGISGEYVAITQKSVICNTQNGDGPYGMRFTLPPLMSYLLTSE